MRNSTIVILFTNRELKEKEYIKRNASSCLWGVWLGMGRQGKCFIFVLCYFIFFSYGHILLLENILKRAKQEIRILLKTTRFNGLKFNIKLKQKIEGTLQIPTKYLPNLCMSLQVSRSQRRLSNEGNYHSLSTYCMLALVQKMFRDHCV